MWIKVKTNHILHEYSDLSDSEFRAWIKIMALTAQLEHEPTHEQMINYIHHKTLLSLQLKFNKRSITLQDVLKKVLRDVQEVVNKKEYWKIQKQKQRALTENVLKDIPEKSRNRLDKIREDKIKDNISNLERPTFEMVKTYCLERKNHVDPHVWIDHYTSNGWMVGRNKMKDWKAAVRTWERLGFERGNGKRKPQEVQTQHRNPFTMCTKCGEEYMENDIIDVNGSFYCPKCPEARAASLDARDRVKALVLGIGGRAP
jgi:hypothetical protein